MSALAPDAPPKAPNWREMAPGRLLKTLRLTATEHDVWMALCDVQRGAHAEVFGGAIAITKAIDPNAEWREFRTAKGRPYLHSRRFPQVKRAIWALRKKGLIRLIETGGGKQEGGAGRASKYALGLAVDAYWEGQRRPLKVVNSVANDTVPPAQTVSPTTLFNSVTHDTPSSYSSGSTTPSRTPDDAREGRPASRRANGPTRPDVLPGPDTFTRVGTLLAAGPHPVREAEIASQAPPPPAPKTDMQRHLETPIEAAPNLELPPPRRR